MKDSLNIGDRVRFLPADIFLPGQDTGMQTLSEVTELDGTLIGFSDSGSRTKAFAVVEVVRRQTVVIPVEKLEYVARPVEGAAADV